VFDAATQGEALGYHMWPFQGQELTSSHRRLDYDHTIKKDWATHRFW